MGDGWLDLVIQSRVIFKARSLVTDGRLAKRLVVDSPRGIKYSYS